MICIKNNLTPFKGYKAINLFGIVFTREDLTDKEKNHERIHSLQIVESAILGFYLFSSIVLIFNFDLLI